MTKPNVITHNIQGVSFNPEQICSDCHRQILNCEACRFMNSQLSIDQLRELKILRQSMDLVQLENGTYRIRVEYPLKSDPFVTFHPKNSQINVVKNSSVRLRTKLVKLGLFECFTKQITDALKDNHLEIVQQSDLMIGPVHYVPVNYQLKNSVSTPCRLTTNSSFPNKVGKSLNSEAVVGPSYLGNGCQVMFNFRRHDLAYNSDISKFYRQILTANTTNRLRRIFWYLNEDDEELTCFQFIRATYGDSPISILSEICFLDYIAPSCKTQELAEACLSSRLVDDVCHSVRNKETLERVRLDMEETFSKYNFNTKHFLYTGMSFEPDEPHSQQVLGAIWLIDSDQLALATELNISPKVRGKYKLPPLDIDQARFGHLDKNAMSRVSGQLYDQNGTFLTPVQCTCRISFSRTCKKVKTWNEPIKNVDPELDRDFRNLLVKLVDIKNKINPIPRPVAFNSKITKIFVSSDASQEALGLCIHVLSVNSQGVKQCHLLCSKTKIHQVSVPVGEIMAVTKAARELTTVFQMTPSYFESCPLIVFVTDSHCTAYSLNPEKIHQHVAIKNNAHSIHSVLTNLSGLLPKVSIKMLHAKSSNIAADAVTKKLSDPISVCNSDLFRHGPSCYMSDSFPEDDRVFLTFKNGKSSYKAPKTEQIFSKDESSKCTTANSAQCLYCMPEISNAMPSFHNLVSLSPPAYTTVPVLCKEMYDSLINNCRSLQLLVNTLKIIIKGVNLGRKSKLQTETVLSEFSFKIIMKSHQKYYTTSRVPSMAQVFTDADGVKRACIRMDSSQGPSLLWSQVPYLVDKGDTRLIFLLISNAHSTLSSLNTGVHVGTSITAANLLKMPFPVWLFNAEKACSQFINKCSVCRYLHKQASTTGTLSLPRFHRFVHKNPIVFNTISVDAIGPFFIRCYKGSRKNVKIWIQIIYCVATKFTNFQITEGNTLDDITQAIYRFSCMYRVPESIVSDAGSSANLVPESQVYKKYFGSTKIEIIKVQPSHQFLNQSENQVKNMKKLLRSIFYQRDKLNLSTLTHQELSTNLLTVSSLLNSRPIFKSRNAFLCPNSFVTPWISCSPNTAERLQSTLNPNLELLAQTISGAHKIFVEILRELFLTSKQTWSQSKHRFDFKVNDLILSLKVDNYKLGLISEINSPSYAIVKFKGQSGPYLKPVHFSKLILVHREKEPENPSFNSGRIIDTQATISNFVALFL